MVITSQLSGQCQRFCFLSGYCAVVGTKFTMPSSTGPAAQLPLIQQNGKGMVKMSTFTTKKMLPQRYFYLGELYDNRLWLPENPCIKKADRMYYAFMQNWMARLSYAVWRQPSTRCKIIIINGPHWAWLKPRAELKLKFSDYFIVGNSFR